MGNIRKKSVHCRNCGYAWPEGPNSYCPQCGQKNTDPNASFGHWILEFIEGVFHIDGKIWVTLGNLIGRPGVMSREYMSGRMVRYIPPARLYLFISFLFFLTLASKPDGREDVIDLSEEHLGQRWTSITVSFLDTPEVIHFGDQAPALTRREVREACSRGNDVLDSLLKSSGVAYTSGLEREMWRQAARIETFGPGVWLERILKICSFGAFFLMPAYACMLSWFFRGRWKSYTAHLVFSVHAHSLLFLGLTVGIWLSRLQSHWPFNLLIWSLFIAHPVGLRNFYGNTWPGVIWRYLALTAAYFVLVFAFMVGVVILGFVMV